MERLTARAILIAGAVASLLVLASGSLPILWMDANPNGGLQNIGNLGQFISGLFAPVAFIGLIVAVLLQSKELELQREELRETRDVFNLQKEEMKRAADETREQTAIMKSNLENEASKLEYEKVDLLLYGTAIFIQSNYNFYVVIRPNGNQMELFPRDRLMRLSVTKQSSDTVYAVAYERILNVEKSLVQMPKSGFHVFHEDPGKEILIETSNRLKRIESFMYESKNELVQSRLGGMNFQTISGVFSDVLERISND